MRPQGHRCCGGVHDIVLAIVSLLFIVDSQPSYLDSFARPRVMFLVQCKTQHCEVALNALHVQLARHMNVDVISLSKLPLASINRMANTFSRLSSDRIRSLHYNWIHDEITSYIYSGISGNRRERGGRFILAVGEPETAIDVLVSIVFAKHLRQRTGFIYVGADSSANFAHHIFAATAEDFDHIRESALEIVFKMLDSMGLPTPADDENRILSGIAGSQPDADRQHHAACMQRAWYL